MKLHPKILLFFTPLIVTPLLLLAWTAYSQVRDTTKERTYSQVETVLDQIALEIGGELRTTLANARLFANAPLVERYMLTASAEDRYAVMQPVLIQLFNSYQRAFPDYYELRILLPDGAEDTRVTHHPLPNATDDERDTGYFRAISASNEDPSGTFLRNPDSGEFSLLVWKRLEFRDPGQDPIVSKPALRGYLVITRAMAAIRTNLAQQQSRLGAMFLVDQSGHNFLRDSSSSNATDLPGDIVPTLLNGEGRPQIAGQYRNELTHFFARQVHPSLYLVAAVPEKLLLASTHGVTSAAALITLVAVLVTTLLITIGLRYLVLTPIKTLTRAVHEMGRGNLAAAVLVRGRDEISTLAESFQQMARNVQRSGDQVRYLAYHDSLTGLPNRHMFQEYLSDALIDAQRDRQRLALLFLDLDNFKQINDTLGHHAGDELLRQLSERFSQCLRALTRATSGGVKVPTDLVARLGGDEFVILLPAIEDMREVQSVAQRVLDTVAEPFVVDSHRFHVSTSIGIAVYPTDGVTAQELAKHADMAMYHAKRHGKNNFQLFAEQLPRNAYARFLLENRLRNAIVQEEFVLYYQPQVELATGRICGVEALLRWPQPDFGLMLPEEFIPLAEETGLIVPLGRWVLTEACKQTRRWRASGIGKVRTSVNISNIQLTRDDIGELLEAAVAAGGIAHDDLCIELTETSMFAASERGAEVLARVKSSGVGVALDDFGTGYSSLSVLRRFPLTSLKIDRSFVRDIHRHSYDAAIVSATIALAHSLDLIVIAEGIESQSQLDWLREKGCDWVQGFLLGEAMPAAALTERLRDDAAQAAGWR